MLARLCYPVANPNIDVVFCKGFYSRITDRMHGRVTRLLMTPLLRALQKLVGSNPFLLFLDSFRYPLAGEFCMIEDVQKGLMRMCVDICKSIFRTLAAEGIVLSDSFFKSLQVAYIRLAEDTMVKYEADAAINGLLFDRHEEAGAVEAFASAIQKAAEAYSENPMAAPLIPNWNRVTSAIPGILDMLKKAVDEDNRS